MRRIGWPFMADQPINSTHLVHNLDVAFEFYEVRTGPYGRKPIYMNNIAPSGTAEAIQNEFNIVLDAMKGEQGARKRTNAKRQQGILRDAWAPTGPARKSFESFLTTYAGP